MAGLVGKVLVLAIFLIVHFTAHRKGWYYSRPDIDMITHFLGGLAVSAFVKDLWAAAAMLLAWEFLEMALVNKRWKAFRETPWNKARDVAIGFLGFIIGTGIF